MTALRDVLGLARGLPRFLRGTLTPEAARDIVRARLRRRPEAFLALARDAVYANPRSPFLALLRRAGCELGDLEREVGLHGLEGALGRLREAGVYVTFDELKGRVPIVRGDLSIQVQAADFDNPALARQLGTRSGGSTGTATRIDIDLAHLAERAPHLLLQYDTHALLGAPVAMWNGVGALQLLRGALFGHLPERWFVAVDQRDGGSRLRYLDGYGFVALGRALGCRWPWPRQTPPADALVVARWAHEALRRSPRVALAAMVSNSVRVCVAAHEAGLDLRGLVCIGGGEPATPAKVARIQAAGARYVPAYVMAEAGHVGIGCASPMDPTDVHLAADAVALSTVRQALAPGLAPVDAFCLTSLLPHSARILLNAVIDDFGVVEERDCGCPLSVLGLRTHVRQIYSGRKLTSEGMSLAGADLLRLLEQVLPTRFGGSALDWQLREEEDENALTRVALVASPRLGPLDAVEVVTVFLEELSRAGGEADRVARATFLRAGSLRLVREEPLLSPAGKLLPLHLRREARP